MTHPPTSPRRRIADALLRLRDSAGLERQDAARRAGIDRATLSQIENGHTAPQPDTLDALLNLYHADESERTELHGLRKEARRRR